MGDSKKLHVNLQSIVLALNSGCVAAEHRLTSKRMIGEECDQFLTRKKVSLAVYEG